MLFSVKSHSLRIGGFFHYWKPLKRAVWRYVLLYGQYGSDMVHNLKINWFNLLLRIGHSLFRQRLSAILDTKIQHDVIRVIAITDV